MEGKEVLDFLEEVIGPLERINSVEELGWLLQKKFRLALMDEGKISFPSRFSVLDEEGIRLMDEAEK